MRHIVSTLSVAAANVKELKRVDGQLKKHVRDMEDFEAKSKDNRPKLLSGAYTYAAIQLASALVALQLNC